MNATVARFSVAVVILLFAWKGSTLDIPWPPKSATPVNTPVPAPEERLRAWAEPLRPILPAIMPHDRAYLSSLYDAMSFVLLRDGQRDEPIVSTTDKLASFHANSLRLAIDKDKVGKYDGLDGAIDAVFMAAAGPEVKPLDKDTRTKVVAACQVLSWAFAIKKDE
jgi:hypothetical protein